MDNYQIIHFNHPLEIKKLSFLDISKGHSPIDEVNSKQVFIEDFHDLIKPKLKTVLKMAHDEKYPLIFFSLSFLKLLKEEDPNLMLEIKKLESEGKMQLVGSCAYHSFSYLCSPILFKKEVEFYLEGLKTFFEKKPDIFINTACLYDDQLAEIVNSLGYDSIIATANPWHLAGKHSGQVYRSNTSQPFSILLSNGDGPDNFQISLVNGYGSAYTSDYIDISVTSNKLIQELLIMKNPEDHSVYAVSLPLSSPSWEHKIPDYTNNPLQKALINQATELVNKFHKNLSDDDFMLLMLLCQPDHLLKINQTSKEEGYDHFISSMNWLTQISLKYK